MARDLEYQNTDAEPKKPSGRILEAELKEALGALDRSSHRLFFSGLSTGLDLGFSLVLIAVVRTSAEGILAPPVLELLVATMYSFGFIIVVIGHSELFTEQTSLAVLPLLMGRTSFRKVARLWGIVYVSNLIGAALVAELTVLVGPGLGVIEPPVFGRIAERFVAHPAWVILLSGVLAGWLMGLLSWLVAAGRDTISQIVIVWLITGAIGLGHMHHSILGSVEVLAGVFAGEGTTWGSFGHFLFWTTLGNAIGGPLFVTLLRYGHARPPQHRG